MAETANEAGARRNTGEQRKTENPPDLFYVLAILAATTAIIIKWRRDSVAFAAVSGMDLLILFYTLRHFDRNPRYTSKIKGLKNAVLSVSIHLIFVFSDRIATVMPLPAKVIIWCMSTATICAITYLFFFHEDCDHHLEIKGQTSKKNEDKQIGTGTQATTFPVK